MLISFDKPGPVNHGWTMINGKFLLLRYTKSPERFEIFTIPITEEMIMTVIQIQTVFQVVTVSTTIWCQTMKVGMTLNRKI